ncbi:periplasmic nitrate reductase subunit NapB [Sinobacterium caligoides]|uniref:Periplasmic nitrate reductase, electron transfer subunit n=1 Tax=Sinobacterium caligoides TaxID=933926 RepID=A0A3N2DPC7_9GAMM|nr:nitrate reductase cytochrome c-type subunit [Sinobacterium caligoides]ROS01562.1 periplasmic nitrate reductase subunit NapB [Sinobacterium caligoides]
MKKAIIFICGALLSSLLLADTITTLRSSPIDQEATPPALGNYVNDDSKQHRNYPMQPPIIPHHVDHYQTDLFANKCLSCHARKRTSESQAPMVSVTHYMDRFGNFRADVSPRRYFCRQCHVPQTSADATVENTFIDMDDLPSNEAK